MSTQGGLVEMPNGGRAHDHETGGGGHVRADQQADYELISPLTASDPVVIDLERGVLWVSIPAAGGQTVTIRRHGFEFVTSVGSAVIEAGASGDTLVLVAEGELSLVDHTGTARLLSRRQGGVLAADGTLVVDEVHDDELAADPWVAANTLLDRAAQPTTDRRGRPSPDPRAVVAGVLARLRPPRGEPEDSVNRDPSGVGAADGSTATKTDEDTMVLAPLPTTLDRRANSRLLPLIAAAVLVLIIVLLVVLSDDDIGNDPARGGEQAKTTIGGPTTGATSAPTSTAGSATSEPVRAELDPTAGCVQRGDVLVVTGTAENARAPADRYRIEVAVRTRSGRVLGRGSDTVAVPDDGSPVDWQVRVAVDRSLAGTGAECEVTEVRTLEG